MDVDITRLNALMGECVTAPTGSSLRLVARPEWVSLSGNETFEDRLRV